jgi:SSS family solute:Na+ symporter
MLATVDWAIIIAYNLVSVAIGVAMTRRAHRSTEEYFLAGRALPWWIAGTSMVATSFSCDTPLYVCKLVRTVGIYENWQWWCFGIGSLFAAFFLAPLWRRAGVLTDVELTERRYGSGRPARFLRGFRALWLALPINVIAMGWVILAMAKIMNAAVGWDKLPAVLLFTGLAFLYTTLAGLWGVALTDLVQYIVAQGGAIIFAVFAVQEVGGLASLHEKVTEALGSSQVLQLVPSPGSSSVLSANFWSPALIAFGVYTLMVWWANVNADGGGKVIQRQNACRNEEHALLATLWYSLSNLAFRSWPWILVALATIVIYPQLSDPEMGYPQLMMDILPAGIKGLLVASLLAAFMSTISTQLNWGASYLVHDFYRRFIVQGGSERHYLVISKVATALVLGAAGLAAYWTQSVTEAFKFIIAFGSGTGPVYILRWLWWRVNAWSEISAMVASSVISIWTFTASDLTYAEKLLVTVFGSAVVWVCVTLLTAPASREVLQTFYKHTRPMGVWGYVRRMCDPDAQRPASVARPLRGFVEGVALVLGLTIGIGYLLLGSPWLGVLFIVIAALGIVGLWLDGYLRTGKVAKEAEQDATG